MDTLNEGGVSFQTFASKDFLREKISGKMSLGGWLDYCGAEDAEAENGPRENQSPKSIYQDIEEAARSLSIQSSRSASVEDLFASNILETRNKIRDLCVLLITKYSPKSYGPCAREKLWKYVFYDAVQRARKLQRERPWTPLQLAYVKCHLESGISELYGFVKKIQESEECDGIPLMPYATSLDGILDMDMVEIKKSRDLSEDDKNEQKKLIELMAMCFINIGDLYRYMRDIYSKAPNSNEDEANYFYRAQEWYTHAFLMNPAGGLSLNQLGNIYSDRNWGIDSVYYLLYSSLTLNAYEGALPNLRHLLDGKMVQFARRAALPEPRPLEILCNGFINLLFQMLFDETQINYEKMCQEILANFHERLATFDPDLDEKFLFKFATISVMIVWRLQAINSIHTSPAVAFAMSVFFTLVTQIGTILNGNAKCDKINSSQSEKDMDRISVSSSVHNDKTKSTTVSNKTPKKEKKKRKKGRGRRYTRSSSVPSLRSLDSESDSDGHLDDSDEEDENSEFWTDSSDYNSESDEDEENNASDQVTTKAKGACGKAENSNGKAFSSLSSNSQTSGSGTSSQKSIEGLKQELLDALHSGAAGNKGQMEKEKVYIDVEDLLKCRSKIEPLLVALTPFIRWIQTSPAVKDALAANSEKIFLEKLCEMLSLLTSKNWISQLTEMSVEIGQKLEKEWEKMINDTAVADEKLFQYQLAEDRSLLGLGNLLDFVRGLEINEKLADQDQLVIRIGRLVHFGMWMNKTESFSMMYSVENHTFFVPTPDMLRNQMRTSKMKRLLNGTQEPNSLNRLTKAYQEMKLENKRERQRGGRNGRNNPYQADGHGGNGRRRRGGRCGATYPRPRRHVDDKPICVIVDLDATLKYFDLVKRLASDKNFIVCVPNSVFESMDMMKDNSKLDEMTENAKLCYQWMDSAIKRNHPGIRLLKKVDKKKLSVEYPEDDNEIEVWEYLEMLECCRYLMDTVFEGSPYDYVHSVFGDNRDKYSVFYLSGNDTLLDTSVKRGFDPIKIARSLPGVFVDCIKEYPPRDQRRKEKKWRTPGKCKG